MDLQCVDRQGDQWHTKSSAHVSSLADLIKACMAWTRPKVFIP
jgi:hypothetical protein